MSLKVKFTYTIRIYTCFVVMITAFTTRVSAVSMSGGEQDSVAHTSIPSAYSYPVALRTNLLLDIVGGPNVGVDMMVGEHISVGGDFAWAYTRIVNLYALQTLQGTIEGRWWFKPKGNILTGWNVGLYGTYSSRFDIQWGRGYQGDGYLSLGVSGGYAWRLSDRLNLDVSALVGVVWMPEVRYYGRPQDGRLMWNQTRYNATRFLPTMLRVNLVWLLGGTKKRDD